MITKGSVISKFKFLMIEIKWFYSTSLLEL